MTWTIYAILLPAITASFVYISLSIPLRLTFLVFCNVESIEIFWRAYSLDGEKLLWWKTSPQMKTNRYVICHVHESSGFSFLTIQFPAECRTLTTLVSLYFFFISCLQTLDAVSAYYSQGTCTDYPIKYMYAQTWAKTIEKRNCVCMFSVIIGILWNWRISRNINNEKKNRAVTTMFVNWIFFSYSLPAFLPQPN